MPQQTVLITGATRGLGLATAEALASQDYQVILTGRNPQSLAELASLHPSIAVVEMDVADDQSVQQAKSEIALRFERLDCLVNNAGVILESSFDFDDLPSQVIADTLNINTLGAVRTMQAFRSLLSQSDNPRVINISSGMGVIAGMGPGHTAYRMSKAALNVATLQAHYALHEQYGIRVLAVCPGWVQTDMGGPDASRNVQQGIEGILWAVNSKADVPGGQMYRDGFPVGW